MSEIEILRQILNELKEINNTVQDLYSSTEAQHELLMNRVSVLENIAEKSKDILTSIEDNTK